MRAATPLALDTCTSSLKHQFCEGDKPHALVDTISTALPLSKSTIISYLNSCSAFSSGQAIHALVLKSGFAHDRFIGSSLVSFYGDFGLQFSARAVFDVVPDQDVVMRTAMLRCHVASGDLESARKLFDEMPEKDVIAWNAMISGYAQTGSAETALQLFRDMQVAGVEVNEITIVTALSACSKLGSLALGESIHSFILKDVHVKSVPTLRNALVNMYAKCGRLDTALELFFEMEPKNLESWNAILTAFAFHGNGFGAAALLGQMIKNGTIPDRITFLGLLVLCSHTGRVDLAWSLLDAMRVYGINPEAEHYGCMVDALSRAGYLEDAFLLVKIMPYDADARVLGALLNGCYMHGHHDMGLDVAQLLLELQPLDEGRYVALANLYQLSGRSVGGTLVKKKMLDMGIKKSSGTSTVEIEGNVHEFVAGDTSHCQAKDIYLMMESIRKNL